MYVKSDSFVDGGKISTDFALARPVEPGPVEFSGNRNPHLAWGGVPDGVRSFAITAIDPDCPSAPDDVNQPDREVPATLPRVDFTHWLVANIPSDVREIDAGSHSEGVTEGGKDAAGSPAGVHGTNDYTMWFAGDESLEGQWCGYDGPAPPWNDSIPHRYIFSVYAIDVEHLPLNPGFTRDELDTAMEGHVLAEASITGTYAQNPRLH